MKNTKNSVSSIEREQRGIGDLHGNKQMWLSATVVLMSFLLPQITVCGGLSPLGVGLAAAVNGAITIPVFLASFIGYLLKDITVSLRYLSALIAVLGLRWSVCAFPKILKSRYFAPTVSFIGCLVTGCALSLSGQQNLSTILLIVAESLIASSFSYFCTLFFEETFSNAKKRNLQAKLGTLIVLCVTMMITFSWEWQGISLGRIISLLSVMTAVQCGGIRGGLLVGSISGMMAFLRDPSQVYLIPLFVFGGLLSALLSDKGRFFSMLMFIAVDTVVWLTNDVPIGLNFVISLYEILTAFLLTFIVPIRAKEWMRALIGESHGENESCRSRDAAAKTMKKAASTMTKVAGTVDAISRELAVVSAPNIGSLYRSISDRCCHDCKKRLRCWEHNFSDTMDSFNHMTAFLNSKGEITPTAVQGSLKENCVRLDKVCESVNNGYQEFIMREAAFDRLYELRGIINDQFENTAQILMEFSHHFEQAQWNDAETAVKIEAELKKAKKLFQSVNCCIEKDGHMEVEVALDENCSAEDIQDLCHLVREKSGRKFSLPTIEYDRSQTRIYLSEGQIYRAIIGAAQSKCKGEKLCGDAVEVFRDNSGNQFVVLSDGMGTGGRAAVDGAMTAGLTAEMLKAGFGYESVLRIINTALMAKSEDESLATLDIACINLFTGDLTVLKAGAGISLLLSKERVSRIDESSLPLGILRELTFACTYDRLVEGDILLLMSDGISNDDIRWVEEMLRSFNKEEITMQTLSQNILDAALKINPDAKGDDMTVIAVKLEKTDDNDEIQKTLSFL